MSVLLLAASAVGSGLLHPLTPAGRAASLYGRYGALGFRRSNEVPVGLPAPYADRYGRLATAPGVPLSRFRGPLVSPAEAVLAGRPGLLPRRYINQGNPLNLRPDGFVDGLSRPYSFDTGVLAPEYGNEYGHTEESDGDVTQGAYQVLLPDGRHQVVTYTVGGDSGFQAEVRYEK